VVEETVQAHPRGLRQAYADIEIVLNRFDFVRVQGSVYLGDEDLTRVVHAMNALKAPRGFP